MNVYRVKEVVDHSGNVYQIDSYGNYVLVRRGDIFWNFSWNPTTDPEPDYSNLANNHDPDDDNHIVLNSETIEYEPVEELYNIFIRYITPSGKGTKYVVRHQDYYDIVKGGEFSATNYKSVAAAIEVMNSEELRSELKQRNMKGHLEVIRKRSESYAVDTVDRMATTRPVLDELAAV